MATDTESVGDLSRCEWTKASDVANDIFVGSSFGDTS